MEDRATKRIKTVSTSNSIAATRAVSMAHTAVGTDQPLESVDNKALLVGRDVEETSNGIIDPTMVVDTAAAAADDEIDDSLYSRQRYVLVRSINRLYKRWMVQNYFLLTIDSFMIGCKSQSWILSD